MKNKYKPDIKLFRDIALMGSATFLQNLVPKTKFDDYVHFNKSNSRIFLLLKLISDVQKFGFVLERWNNLSDNYLKPNNSSIEAQRYNSLIDEQSLWQRKLLESLILLINFTSTNTEIYYYHFLLLHEIKDYYYRSIDQKEFFNHKNTLTEKTIEFLHDQIKLVETDIGDLSKCWYLKSLRRQKNQFPKIASLRKQMIFAFKIATTPEKLSLGKTYASAYGETSNDIHFSPTKNNYSDKSMRFSFEIAHSGLLLVAILKRAHKLTGIIPKGINTFLSKNNDVIPRNNNNDFTSIKVGDFVLCDGPFLGEILEISISTYGLESYRVKYLTESPIKGINEAWFPSVNVELYMRKSDVTNEVHKILMKVSKDKIKKLPSFSKSQISNDISKAVIIIWNIVKEKYYEDFFTWRVGYRGIGYEPDSYSD